MAIRAAVIGAAAIWVSASGAAEASERCTQLFDEVRTSIETNYLGYVQAIAPSAERSAIYRANADRARIEAGAASDDNCTLVVQRFVAQLDDPHVFLLERPTLTEAEAAASRASAERRDANALRVRPSRGARGLEGAWAGPDFDVAIIPDGARRRGHFIAVVTHTRSDAWSIGDVAGRFVRDGDAWMATLYRSEDRAPVRGAAVLQREGRMLHMPPLTWGRRDTADLGFDPEKPRAPYFANLSDEAALITIPSFSPEHQQEIADVLTAHDGDIRGRNVLIVDLRGNEGGSAGLGQMLAPYFYTAERRPALGPRVFPMALSSPLWLRYYGQIRDSLPEGEDRAFFDDFLRRMEAAPGALVPYFENADFAAELYAVAPPQSVHETPRDVAIIVDRYSVSAAEAFVLEARRSTRVTVFGEPTGGSIDYQNVSMSGVGAGRLRHWLGLPSSAASDELPERGFNAAGVPVDVSLQGERDWIAAVQRHYRRR